MAEKEEIEKYYDEKLLKIMEETQRIEERYRREKAALITKIWRSRISLTRVGGATLVTAALLTMIYAFQEWNPFLEIIGIVLFFSGFSIMFSRVGGMIKGDIVGKTVFSSLKVIYTITKQFDVQGSEIYLPPNKEGKQGKVFLAFKKDEQELSNLSSENRLILPGKGIIIPSMGDSLIEYMEEELATDFSDTSVDFLCDYLPPLIMEGLEIADLVSMSQDSDRVSVKIEGNRFISVCEEVAKKDYDCQRISCPLCAALAGIVSKVTKKPVKMKKEVNLDRASLDIGFQLIS
jgi:hypothetical protein